MTDIPEGYVLVPKETYDLLIRSAQPIAARSAQPIVARPSAPFETESHYLPKCGCPLGSACGNAACPHRAIVAC